ncbi:hypothetical protein BBJ28_00000026 [Nothophytophthora sp. Chile5]|nr:hypothetical protein BBJ28_00000026 [Nothophytophthora sp. Chile5]
MKNDPRENSEQPEAGEEEAETPSPPTELTAEEGAPESTVGRVISGSHRELARLAARRANVRAQIGVTSATMEQLDAAMQEKLLDLFDNEALWDAEDTDGYILQLFHELETAGADLTALKDQGWNSLLHTTALWDRPKIMEELIRRGAELNGKNKNGHTPLDLAMHWGHFELGQQLQHYGGKHTCEKERDIAISQRDLAQQQLRTCEAELEHALGTLKRAKQEREELRIERDRLVLLHGQVVEECTTLTGQMESLRRAVAETAKERDALQVRAAQLQVEIGCEQTARNNAVHSWKVAEQLIAELQQVHEECREREEQALQLRNEALQERDVARELAREAQLDQGVAKQNQREVERARDLAVQQMLESEAEVAHDKETWRKRIAKTELERRNIQIEIDRQTELLRCEVAKLEKTVTSLTVAKTRQREQLEQIQLEMLALETQLGRQTQELTASADQGTKVTEQVRALQEERRQEHRVWRDRLEAKLQLECSANLKVMLGAAISTWKTLQSCQQRVAALDTPPIEANIPSPSRAPAMSAIFHAQRPRTAVSTAPESPSKPRVLPFLQDSMTLAMKSSNSAPVLPSGPNPPRDPSPAPFVDYTQTITTHRSQAEAALEEIGVGSTAEQLTALCSFVQRFLPALVDYIAANLQHLRSVPSTADMRRFLSTGRGKDYAALATAMRVFHEQHQHFVVPYGFQVPESASSTAGDKTPTPWPEETRGMKLGIEIRNFVRAFAAKAKPQQTLGREQLTAVGFPEVADWKQFQWEQVELPALRTFQELEGNLLVSRKFVVPEGDPRWPRPTWGFRLGSHVNALRSASEKLPAYQIEDLDTIGFIWVVSDYTWDNMFMPALRRYRDLYGHAEIPQSFIVPAKRVENSPIPSKEGEDTVANDPSMWPENVHGYRLGSMVNRIRALSGYGEYVMRDALELEELGFSLNSYDQQWTDKILPALEKFSRIHGHCDIDVYFIVPEKAPWPQDMWGIRLGFIAQNIRCRGDYYQQVARDQNRLEELGFVWNVSESKWRKRVMPALAMFVQLHGNADIPPKFVVPSMEPWPEASWRLKLGELASNIERRRKLADYISIDRMQLEALGFFWSSVPGDEDDDEDEDDEELR